jgi:GAF domain-containing protein
MERTPRRGLSLAIENDGSELTPTLEELLSIMLGLAMLATRATGAAIALSEGREMVCWASLGTAPAIGARLDPSLGFSGMSMRTSRILLCEDSEIDPRVDRAACRRLGVRSMIATPLLNRTKTVGILEVLSSNPLAFDYNDIRQLSLVVDVAVEILAKARPADTEGRVVAG